MSVGRRQKDAVKDHLARDEPSFELWRHELDTVFNETDGLVEVQKRNISKQWIRVNRHLFHSVSAVLGYAATSRLTLDCWQSNKTLSKQLKNRLHWLRRLRQRVMLSCDFLFMNTQGKPLDPKYQ
ncbi:hypothetical protein ONE63_005104 [Megalurothrips usitatus]|uniref:Uncharacterized protein n=1 Tax=Megalurothrips usitatus TaxID=439358 RepID=A0AAV7Y0M5_9NEOP|nr:hypothetical protein ONE63_005104 [Megalurothrips usitatus]